MADERRDGRRDRDDRDDDRRKMKCRPHFGDIAERVEIIKRAPPDDAREVLMTIIESAYYAGVACGCCECQCKCDDRYRRDDDDWRRRRRDD